MSKELHPEKPCYRRRTHDEADALAKQHFAAGVREHLSADELEELRTQGQVTGGSCSSDWVEELGHELDKNAHYEFQIYLPSEECPYIKKYYARILVSRDRAMEDVWIKWKPELSEYNGPWFS